MVIINTRTLEVSIQAVSPVSILTGAAGRAQPARRRAAAGAEEAASLAAVEAA